MAHRPPGARSSQVQLSSEHIELWPTDTYETCNIIAEFSRHFMHFKGLRATVLQAPRRQRFPLPGSGGKLPYQTEPHSLCVSCV